MSKLGNMLKKVRNLRLMVETILSMRQVALALILRRMLDMVDDDDDDVDDDDDDDDVDEDVDKVEERMLCGRKGKRKDERRVRAREKTTSLETGLELVRFGDSEVTLGGYWVSLAALLLHAL
jgi:hypothetical protein